MLETLYTFGLGTLTIAIVQFFMTIYRDRKTLRFTEKKEAYLGLLEAYHHAAVQASPKAAKEFALWQIRCELAGSTEVTESMKQIIDSNDNFEKRTIAHEKMKQAMKRDLGVV